MSIPPWRGAIPLLKFQAYNRAMLPSFWTKVKNWFTPRENELLLAATIILVAFISFGLGRLSALHGEKFPIKFIEPPNQEAAAISPSLGRPTSKLENSEVGLPKTGGKLYVASKNGSVYHFPWCPGAQRIKEANKIYFSSREEAEKAGYRPAANCEGL